MEENEIFEPELVIEFPVLDEDPSAGNTSTTEVDEAEIKDTGENPVEENIEDKPSVENQTDVNEKTPNEDKLEGNTDDKPSDIDPRIDTHYKYMVDQGLLLVGDDFEFDGSNIEEAYQLDTQIRTNQIAQQLIDSFPDRGKDFINYMLSGGNDLDGFFKINSKIEVNESYDVSKPEQAKQLITEHMSEIGVPASAIEHMIEGYELSDKLTEEADKIKSSKLASLNQAKLDKAAEEARLAEEARNNAMKYYEGANDYLNTTKWNQEKKSEVLNFLFRQQSSGKSQAEEILESISKSPKASVVLADILLGYDVSKDDWSFKRIEDSLKSRVTSKVKNSFDKYLGGSDQAIVKSNADPTDKNNSFSWDDVEIVENFDN